MTVDLSRFVEAHERDFAAALAEMEAGRKRSHWIWYVFPQIVGLARSSTARHYGIASVEEARAFLAHPVLGANYRRVVAAVEDQVVRCGVRINTLMGGSPDDVKLVSSLTLFAHVADPDDEVLRQATAVLAAARAQGFSPCTLTEQFLGGT